jgi:translation initiation factor 3 subunit L
MSQPRAGLWVTEEIDDDLQVDVNLALGNYGQNGLYEDGSYLRLIFRLSSVLTPSLLRNAAQPRIDEATLVAVQHQMAQQAAFAQIPDAVKRVRIILITNKERRRRVYDPSLPRSLLSTSIKPFWRTTSQR